MILEQLQYGFARDSRRVWRQRATTQGWDNAYVYDSLSQVLADNRGDLNLACNAIAGIPSNGACWQYDETGNWHGYQTQENGVETLTQSRMHDKGNRLMQVSDAAAMRTDRAGRMLATVPGPKGKWESSYQITWDAWSRITAVGSVAGETATPLAAYTYDGLTRRITRYTNEEDVTLHSFYNEEWRPVEARKDGETSAAVSYLWGSRHRDDLVRRDRAVGVTNLNESRYVLMDYFSPASITDEEGAVTERYQFSAFGLRTILNSNYTVRNSSECAMEFSFQGQFQDEETGWLDYGYRYYLPELGRWACKDPISNLGGDNIYATDFNDAINKVDYLGLASTFPDCCNTEKAAWEKAQADEKKADDDTKDGMTVLVNKLGTAESKLGKAGLASGVAAGQAYARNRPSQISTTSTGRANATSRRFGFQPTEPRQSSAGTKGASRLGLLLDIGAGLLAAYECVDAWSACDEAVAAQADLNDKLAKEAAAKAATQAAKNDYDNCKDAITDCRCGFK